MARLGLVIHRRDLFLLRSGFDGEIEGLPFGLALADGASVKIDAYTKTPAIFHLPAAEVSRIGVVQSG